MEKEKVRYTYRTDSERLKELKILAIKRNVNINELLNQLVDSALEIDQATNKK